MKNNSVNDQKPRLDLMGRSSRGSALPGSKVAGRVGFYSYRSHSAILLGTSLLMCAITLLPLLYVFVRLAEAEPQQIQNRIFSTRVSDLLLSSFYLLITVTFLCILIGVSLAWLVTRTNFLGSRLLSIVAIMPLAIPTYVAGFAWTSLFPTFDGFVAATVVLTACSYPYVFIPVTAALVKMDPAQEEASRSLGNGPFATFRQVTFRQLRPSIVHGSLLVSLYVLSDFGAVSLLRYDTMTRAIFTAFNLGFDRTSALVYSSILIIITVFIVASTFNTKNRAGLARVGTGASQKLRKYQLRYLHIPSAVSVLFLLICALGVPAFAISYWAISGTSMSGWKEIGSSINGSLSAAGLGAIITLLLALPTGIIIARTQVSVSRMIEGAIWISHALPGVVVGLSLIFFSINVWFGLYQSLFLLALGYVALFAPLAVNAVATAMKQSPPILAETALSLGKSPLAVFRTITLPLAAPGIGAGFALVFLACIKELPATLLLGPTGFDTLATSLWTETAVGAYAAAAPYAALLVVVSVIPTWLITKRSGVFE